MNGPPPLGMVSPPGDGMVPPPFAWETNSRIWETSARNLAITLSRSRISSEALSNSFRVFSFRVFISRASTSFWLFSWWTRLRRRLCSTLSTDLRLAEEIDTLFSRLPNCKVPGAAVCSKSYHEYQLRGRFGERAGGREGGVEGRVWRVVWRGVFSGNVEERMEGRLWRRGWMGRWGPAISDTRQQNTTPRFLAKTKPFARKKLIFIVVLFAR